MNVSDFLRQRRDVGKSGIPEDTGTWGEKSPKVIEYPHDDIHTDDYFAPDGCLDESAECRKPQQTHPNLTDHLAYLRSLPIEGMPDCKCVEPAVKGAFYTLLRPQQPDSIPTGYYSESKKAPVPNILPTKSSIRRTTIRLPDISAGLGNREESKNFAALERYVASAESWLNYNDTLCLYAAPYWRKLENEDSAVRVIRTLFSSHDGIRDSLTASDFAKIYRGLKSNPEIPALRGLKPMPNAINCKDGTLNLMTGEVHPPCPEDYFFYAFDLSCSQVLNPPMYGDYFETFVHQISGGNQDVRRQLLEMLAIAMTGTQLKYFYVMLGPSNSGKSQWGRFVQELLGHENVASVQSVADFGSRFTTGSLYGKLLVSCLDLPNNVLPQGAIGVLKTFCGSDSVKGEMKYKQSFTYYQKPLVMLAGNHPVKVPHADCEDALLNRMIVIPFADPGLDESERILDLYQHFLDEAPYIVHEALQAFQDLADRNWAPTRVPVPEAYATQEGDQTLLAVRSFVEDCVLYAADSQVSTEELYDAYREYAFDEGFPELNKTAFGRVLSSVLNQAVPEAAPVKRVRGIESRGYTNIALA